MYCGYGNHLSSAVSVSLWNLSRCRAVEPESRTKRWWGRAAISPQRGNGSPRWMDLRMKVFPDSFTAKPGNQGSDDDDDNDNDNTRQNKERTQRVSKEKR
jgi:hypothetical protein